MAFSNYRAPPSVDFVRKLTTAGGINNSGIDLYRNHYTKVYTVRKTFAAKQISNGCFYKEYEIARALKGHRNCNRLKYWYRSNDPPREPRGHLWFEYSDLGTLHDLWQCGVKQGYERMPQDFILSAACDILEGLTWMHFRLRWESGERFRLPRQWVGITHNDLHLKNIFLSSKTTRDPIYPRVVIGDFGNCTKGNGTDQLAQRNSDVKDVGCIIAILAGASYNIENYQYIFAPDVVDRLKRDGVKSSVINVIGACWPREPQTTHTYNVASFAHEYRKAHHEMHGPPTRLHDIYVPSTRERQPCKNYIGWGTRR